MKLNGKIALITGGSSGIGAALVRLFVAEGAHVIITSHSSKEQGMALCQEMRESGGKASYLSADLSQESQIQDLFQKIQEEFGRLDILINNAGRTFAVPFQELTGESIQRDLEVNLVSAMLCAKYAAPLMGDCGWIVNTTSIRGMTDGGRPGIMGYSAAKAGVISFTKTLALQLAPQICVNAIAPGFVATDYLKSNTDPALLQQWLEHIPMSEFVELQGIAEAYLFLCSSRSMTGVILPVDGGYTLLNR